MSYTIFSKLEEYFTLKEFQQIPTDTNKVVMYATFQNTSLYLINIISLSDSFTFSKELFSQYKDITMRQFSDVNASKIILLNIIITEDTKSLYEDLNYTPNFDDHLIDINWLIDDHNHEFIIPAKQVNSVIGIEKDIEKLLDDNMTYNKNIKQLNKTPIITYTLLIINIMLWVFIEIVGGSTTNIETLIKSGAMHSLRITTNSEYWRLITSMFIHIGATHLFFNSFSLYIFGTRLEKYMKWWEFLLLYMGSGLCGSLLSLISVLILFRNVSVSAGASGAIYGLIGGLLMFSTRLRKPIGGLTSYTILIIFLIGIIYGTISRGVNNIAHMGGFLGGTLISLIIINYKTK